MSDPAATPDQRPGSLLQAAREKKRKPGNRTRWSSMLRVGFEFALLFAVAVLTRQVLVLLAGGSYPNPLWLPVIVLSLQYGLAGGVASAIIATGIQFADGFPPALMSEDLYVYIGRLAVEPVAWCCVALLVGHIRSRQIANSAELEAELAERNRECLAVADLCTDLRGRIEMLERRIAADARASGIDVAEAVTELHRATWSNLPGRLTRFVSLMTGAEDFSVYLLRGDTLEIAFQPEDEHRLAAAPPIPAGDPAYGPIVNERRVLSAMNPADAVLLGDRWVTAGPLLATSYPLAGGATEGAERVIGVLAIAGDTLAADPEEAARRFSLTCAEVSRLAGRIALIDRWQVAASPRPAQGNTGEEGFATAQSDNRRGARRSEPTQAAGQR
ncbi:MAG TPA: hypothetical protein VGF60_23550, partial [Xanthobacteraceae bacterium]